jgi:uncharacterized protein
MKQITVRAGRQPIRSFHLLAKPTGATCNLDCAYCFFLSKELLYPGSRFRMAQEMLEAYLGQLFAAHGTGDVVVAWQGGEPTLMGLPFFEHAVAFAERVRRAGQNVVWTLQTNGTLLDDAWCRFLAEHRFLVGISVDGPQAMHDTYRVDRGGRPTFERVASAIARLREHGVEYNTLTTLHRANADHPRDVYRFLRDDLGSRYMQFIPIIERLTDPGATWSSWHDRPLYKQEGTAVTERSVTAEQYGAFHIGVFDEWIKTDVGTVFVQLFDSTLENFYGEGSTLCIHKPVCGTALALEHNGDVYSCDHFVEPRYRLGNIAKIPLAELVASPKQRAFGENKLSSLPTYCRSCSVRFACHGGCPKDRFIPTPDGQPGLNYLCAGYKAFFEHVDRPMKTMSDLLKAGHAPAEIMQAYR